MMMSLLTIATRSAKPRREPRGCGSICVLSVSTANVATLPSSNTTCARCFPSPLLSAELGAVWVAADIKAFTTRLAPSTVLISEAALHLAGRSSTGDSLATHSTVIIRRKGEQQSNAEGLMSPKAPGPGTGPVTSEAKSWWVGCCRGEMSGVRL